MPDPPLVVPPLSPDDETVPSSPATPIGERVPRGAVEPRPLVAAGLYERGRFGSGVGVLDVDPPDLLVPLEVFPLLFPEELLLDRELPEPPVPDFVVPVVPPRGSRCVWACCIIRDMNPARRFGSGGGFRPSAMAISSRCRARITKCCCPICHKFEVVQ